MIEKTGTKRELAELLSAVMKHPETPERIIRVLGDAIIDFSSAMDFDSPEIIEQSLRAYEEKHKKLKAK